MKIRALTFSNTIFLSIMKILFTIHHYLDINTGAPGSTLQLGGEYQKLGHDVSYYSYDNLPKKLPDIAKGISFSAWIAAHLLAQSKNQAIDVIDSSTKDAWLWAKWLNYLKIDSPLIVTRSHGLEHLNHLQIKEDALRGNLHLSWKYPLYHGSVELWKVKQSLLRADLVFMLNSEEKKYAVEKLGVDPESITVLPHGIPDYMIGLPFEPLSNQKNSIIRIAQISTYIDRKGIKFSVPALNTILSRYPQVEMTFLGTECSECPNVERVYNDFSPNVRDRIKVIPCFAHEKLPELLKDHQIKLFPSLVEGFGKALIEAMACGLAPVATATTGPLDIVQDGYNGLLVPTRDSQAIEQALENLITDCSQLNRLRQNAYKTAQKYSWRRIAKEKISLYKKALVSKKSRGN